jgi:LmbE family N-acetylglucosaminyl deacetylase
MSRTAANDRQVVLSFLAHPDDAEILCGGTLIRLRDAGYEVHIATATPGDCGSATLPADEIARIRRGEGQAAAAFIGATYHCLESRDVQVFFDAATTRKAIDLFRRINPTLVLTHPREDYMMDHEQVHLLARAAAFAFAIPNASSLPLPPHSRLPHLYYVDPLEGLNPYTGALVKPTTLVDISGVIDRKADMLAKHVSQREWLRAHHGMDEYIDAMKRHGQLRGKDAGVNYAEAFRLHLGHAFPHDDVLASRLGKA